MWGERGHHPAPKAIPRARPQEVLLQVATNLGKPNILHFKSYFIAEAIEVKSFAIFVKALAILSNQTWYRVA